MERDVPWMTYGPPATRMGLFMNCEITEAHLCNAFGNTSTF